jgi:hypothetical protein
MINRTVIIAAICLSGVSGLAGWKLRDGDYQRHLKADARAALVASEGAREVEATNEEIGNEIGQEVETAKATIRYVTRTLIKEVPIYVSQEADARCVVPVGFISVLNHAATGSAPSPDPSGQPAGPEQGLDDDSGVELSTVATSVVENYGYTRELEARVTGWQDWYQRVRANWPVK